MKLKSVTLHNFRCFGEEPVNVDLRDDITALIGANGSGKTAILAALTRLFGPTQSLRTIRQSDFHKILVDSSGKDPNSELYIEVELTFPELVGNEPESNAVPSVFSQMIVESSGGELYCRLRLEAKWTDDGSIEGHVDQNLYWILTAQNPVPENDKKLVSPADRARIQVHYIPANRDPAHEFRRAASNRMGRLVRAISWEEDTREEVNDASKTIRTALSSEKAVGVINKLIQKRWTSLKDEHAASNAELRFADSDFDEIVKDVGAAFSVDDGIEHDLSMLSEGQQSLFYLALVTAVFDVENQIIDKVRASSADSSVAEEEEIAGDETLGFNTEIFNLAPDLMVFALEEPENHLAPHYLARIVEMLRSMTGTGRAQGIFSSHSPSVLRRVLPEEIRHLRRDGPASTSEVRNIILPDSAEESSKFVREAVMAYPELYFGKFVILAEGPSEEVVLPKIASASGLETDTSFVCIVPLGGRHVNHFWRLLEGLKIPFATLLDLDAGRSTGGWARIKYACEQLLELGTTPAELLSFEQGGQTYEIPLEELRSLHERKLKGSEIRKWIRHLERFGVFFSFPLDFDLSMLCYFTEPYKSIVAANGPAIPARESPEWNEYVKRAMDVTLGSNEEGITIYANLPPQTKELFAWYRYLFLSRSKPAIHIQAMTNISVAKLSDNAPTPVLRLLKYCGQEIAL